VRCAVHVSAAFLGKCSSLEGLRAWIGGWHRACESPNQTVQKYEDVMKTQSLLLTILAAWLVLVATGCRNTAQGIGKDMEKAGEKIQEKTQ